MLHLSVLGASLALEGISEITQNLGPKSLPQASVILREPAFSWSSLPSHPSPLPLAIVYLQCPKKPTCLTVGLVLGIDQRWARGSW